MKKQQKTTNNYSQSIAKGEQERRDGASIRKMVLEIVAYLALFFLCVIIVPNYVCHTTIVDGDSMEPSLHDNEAALLEKLSLYQNELKRYDVIVFYPFGPEDRSEQYIKRIIGLPGETVQIVDNQILINGAPISENFALNNSELYPGVAFTGVQLAEDEYFVLGDNRELSFDSRYPAIGNVKKENIEGRLVLVFWPFSHFGVIK